MKHEVIEKNAGLLGVLVAIVISVGGLVEIVPLAFTAEVTQPAPGIEPYTALQLEGHPATQRVADDMGGVTT